jgi:alpha-mannosidase
MSFSVLSLLNCRGRLRLRGHALPFGAAAAVAFFLLAPGSRAQNPPAAKPAGSSAQKPASGGTQASNAAQSEATPQPKKLSEMGKPNLYKQPTLYVIGYAHLDTEWRWEYPQVIDEYLSKTLRNNFALADKYPHYIFNFTGANRYAMFKEYFPADFARLKQYVAAGRWFPAGSSMEESDVNSPAAESLFRQILYGNEFFRHEFGKASEEYMLPDCFGFPSSLPTILSHAGIKGFSTQKLSSGWQPAPKVGGPDSPEKTPEGIPFNVGVWEGPDHETVLAALNPGGYGSDVFSDLSKNNTVPSDFQRGFDSYTWDWPTRVDIDGTLTGIYADYHYVGTGDIGGSPNEDTVRMMEAIETHGMATITVPSYFRRRAGATGPAPEPGAPVRVGDGSLTVKWADADQMFRDMQGLDLSKMPRYKGDLELINHSAGSITSEAYQKRWNRKNELLAAAAEESSVAAAWLGGRTYPQERLNRAWRLVLGGQFHDIMAGTATPQSYNFAWNDDVLAMNQFAGVLTSATEAVASGLDTQSQGTPIVVFNPLNVAREDVVEANLHVGDGASESVTVTGPDGAAVPAQIEPGKNGEAQVLFLARVPSVGFSVFHVQAGAGASSAGSSELHATNNSLENARYRIHIDEGGDVSSIFDKKTGKELLHEPLRLAIITDNPRQWPAWNMDFEDEQNSPRSYVSGPAKIRVIENGPVRATIEVTRGTEGSTFVQRVSLSAGDAGNRIEFGNSIDWHTQDGTLKAVFPLTATNNLATYNWDVGTIQRPNEAPRQFEVASHQWIDLTDQGGGFGATILTDCKYGSDKLNDNTIRLTLIRTPGTRGGYQDQGSQDLGHHEINFGLAAHDGDYRKVGTDWQAWRLNQPLIAFETTVHSGALGKEFSLLKIDNPRVRVLALKKAEQGDDVIVRMVEISGTPEQNVHLQFAAPVISAREVNAQEMPLATAKTPEISGGQLVVSLEAFQPRTFAVKFGLPKSRVAEPISHAVALPYDVAVASHDNRPAEGCFDCFLNSQDAEQGKALPAEMLSSDVDFSGIHFHLAPAGTGKPDAVAARGQTINLPAGKFTRVYLLAASAQQPGFGENRQYNATGDINASFKVDDKPVELNIERWTGFIGQWDNRGWESKQVPIERPANAPPLPAGAPTTRTEEFFDGQITPGFIKRADVAWFASHRHDDAGANEAYQYSYLFAYAIDVPNGAKTLTLPNNERIRILAVTVAEESPEVKPAAPLYDTLQY